MDEDSKRRTRERAMRRFSKELSYEEKRARRAKGVGKPKRGPRQRLDDAALGDPFEDGPEPTIEKMGRKMSTPVSPKDTSELSVAMVLAVHKGQILLDGDRTARLGVHLAVDQDQRVAVGDRVRVSENGGQHRVESIEPRSSLLARYDTARPGPSGIGAAIPLAANVDVAVITVAAADPPLRLGLIDRMLVAVQLGDVAPLVCVNKVDLLAPPARAALVAELAPYREVGRGVTVVLCSTKTCEGLAELRQHITGKTVVFAGHSGVGKSSLLNALDSLGGGNLDGDSTYRGTVDAAGDSGGGRQRATGDVRGFDGKGRHTTTSSEMRPLGGAAAGTWLIDTPGVRSFGLGLLPAAVLAAAFPEFAAAGRCSFGDCAHRDEPDCAVREAVADGRVAAARYASYRRILDADD